MYAGVETYLDEAEVKSRIIDITNDTELKLIGHNFKYDYKVLRRWGVRVNNLFLYRLGTTNKWEHTYQ